MKADMAKMQAMDEEDMNDSGADETAEGEPAMPKKQMKKKHKLAHP